MGFFDFFTGGDDDKETTSSVRNLKPEILPGYPESEAARQDWGKTLSEWKTMPGYGAIAPNWNDIWESARQKVQRYFGGGPEGPGAIAQVRSNLARRGVSESPAAEAEISKLGMQQGNLLQDAAVQQATQEAAFGESGRINWLNSLMQLAGLKPDYWNPGSDTITRDTSAKPGISTMLGEAVGQLGLNYAGGGSSGFDSLDGLLQMFGGGGGSPITDLISTGGGDTGIGDIGGGGGDGFFGFLQGDDFGDVASDPATYGQLAQIAMMFCWVAAEVFNGWDDPRTVNARYFIGHVGPAWLLQFYIKHGPAFAAWIRNKPLVKAIVKPVFQVLSFIGGHVRDARESRTSLYDVSHSEVLYGI